MPKQQEHRRASIYATPAAVWYLEVMLDFMYLAVIIVLAVVNRKPMEYHLHRFVKDLYIDFKFKDDSGNFAYKSFGDIFVWKTDLWRYLESAVMRATYGDISLYLDDGTLPPYIFEKNRLIRAPLVRQVRTKSGPCASEALQHLSLCFPEYSEDYENTSLLESSGNANLSWAHTPGSILGAPTFRGVFAEYGGGGYFEIFPIGFGKNAYETAAEIIRQLARVQWVSHDTRALFVDLAFYNIHADLISVLQIAWELPPTGGIYPVYDILTFRLSRYGTKLGEYVTIPCEALFCLLTLYYLIRIPCTRLLYGSERFWTDTWTYFDLFTLGVSFAAAGLYIYQALDLVWNKEMMKFPLASIANADEYWYPFRYGLRQNIANLLYSTLIFSCLCKISRCLLLTRPLAQLMTTMTRCIPELTGFALMFTVTMLAFVLSGVLLFGHSSYQFNGLNHAMETLTRWLAGADFHAEAVGYTYTLGVSYFLAFQFTCWFFLLNMFLAIVNDAYYEVAQEFSIQSETNSSVMKFRNRLFGWWYRRKLRNPVKTSNKAVRYSTQSLYRKLKKIGFSTVEIEMFMAKYQLHHAAILDESAIERLLQKLGDCIKCNKDESVLPDGKGDRQFDHALQIYDELDIIEERISAMEEAINTMLVKVKRLREIKLA